MKKFITLIMSLILVFSLAACGNQQQGQNTTPEPASEPTSEIISEPENFEEVSEPSAATEIENTSSTTDAESMGGKTLIVYYSASGNTEEVAKYIAAATGGDIFELEPEEPYTDADLNWTDEDSRVSREHNNEEERNVDLVSVTVVLTL